MAAGRTCLIITFPMLGTIVTLFLGILAFLGSYKNTSTIGVNKTYFMRVNISNISTSAITGLSSSESSALDSVVSTVLSELGLPDFYQVGATGYCQGNISDSKTTIQNCSTPYVPYWFDLVTILEDHLPSGVTIDLPDSIQNYEKILRTAGRGLWVCYVIGLAVTAIELFSGLFSFNSRAASCCTAVIGVIAAFFMIVASGLATGIYITYRKYFNEELSSFGVNATLGSTAYILTWVSTGASLLSALWWIFSICCGSTRRRASKPLPEESQPFMGYVSHPRY